MSCTIGLLPAGEGDTYVFVGACAVLACVPGSISPEGWPQQLIVEVSYEARNCNVGGSYVWLGANVNGGITWNVSEDAAPR